jgi:GT2 family glycosyltransferase
MAQHNMSLAADNPSAPAADEATLAGDGHTRSLDVSIIVVNWNTRDLLRDCLQSIGRHAGTETFEIIVADNHSADGSAEMVAAEFPDVRLIRNSENLGFATANNQGIAVARGRYVLLLNSDTVVLEGTIARSLAFAEAHARAAVVGCRTVFPDGRLQVNCYQFPSLLNLLLSLSQLPGIFPRNRFLGRRRLTWWDYDTPRAVDAVAGCFMLVRSEAIRQVGPLAEDYFMYSEDTDWCWRFACAGWQVLYTPEPQLIHLNASSSSKCETDMRMQERRSLLLFLQKKSGRTVRRIANLMFLASCLLQLPVLILYRLCGGDRARASRKMWPLTTAALKFHFAEGFRASLRALPAGEAASVIVTSP